MDPLASEKALSFSEPPVYPSRDFVSIQVVERPTEPARFWPAGSRFSITIRSPGQNEFMDADKMRLEFSVICVGGFPTVPLWKTRQDPINPADNTPVTSGTDCNITRNPATCGLPLATKQDVACNLPGLPAWGLPFFSSVRVQVPGLPLESFLTADRESQWMAATRLMCSSGGTDLDPDVGHLSFGIRGEPEAAGARSVEQRARCVSVGLVRSDRAAWPLAVGPARPADGPPIYTGAGDVPLNLFSEETIGREIPFNGVYDTARLNSGARATTMMPTCGDVQLRGTPIHYSVPLSLFCHLFNSASNMIPLGFYSTSSDTITFTFDVAPATSALVHPGSERPDVAPPDMTFYLIDPEIRFTKVQISNPSILASIESLFRGVAAVPVAPGINVPLAFVMKFINHGASQTRIPHPAGFFNLSIPGNQPSVRGIAIRFCAEGVVNSGLYVGTIPAAATFNDLLLPNDQGVPNEFPPAPGGAAVPEVLMLRPLNQQPPSAGWQRFSPGDGQWGGKYLLSLRPLLRNVILRIASFRVPLDALLDTVFPGTQVPRGAGPLDPFDGVHTAGLNVAALSDLTIAIHQRAAYRLYRQGKHLFSPFAKFENPVEAPLAPLYLSPQREDGAQGVLFQGYTNLASFPDGTGAQTVNAPGACDQFFNEKPGLTTGMFWGAQRLVCGGGGCRDRYMVLQPARRDSVNTAAFTGWPGNWFGCGRSRTTLPYWSAPNLLILPLESIGAVYNHQDDAFALRGLDLRSITQMEFSGEVVGSLGPVGAGQCTPGIRVYNGLFVEQTTANGDRVPPSLALSDDMVASAWTIRAYTAFDQEHVLLPGRVDVEAQFSLLPTGATAIPSGGAPAF